MNESCLIIQSVHTWHLTFCLWQALKNDFSIHQQTLHSIISKGNQIVMNRETSADASDLQQQLSSLSTQWHNILSRTKKRRTDIVGALGLWQKYRSHVNSVGEILRDIDRNTEPTDQIRFSVEKIQSVLSSSMVSGYLIMALRIAIGWVTNRLCSNTWVNVDFNIRVTVKLVTMLSC